MFWSGKALEPEKDGWVRTYEKLFTEVGKLIPEVGDERVMKKKRRFKLKSLFKHIYHDTKRLTREEKKS